MLDLICQLRVFLQVAPGVLFTLAELFAFVGVPGAGLLDDVLLDTEIDKAALAGDALAEEDVELGLPEWSGKLVLDHLDSNPVTHRVLAVLQGFNATDVQTNRGVELESLTT